MQDSAVCEQCVHNIYQVCTHLNILLFKEELAMALLQRQETSELPILCKCQLLPWWAADTRQVDPI